VAVETSTITKLTSSLVAVTDVYANHSVDRGTSVRSVAVVAIKHRNTAVIT